MKKILLIALVFFLSFSITRLIAYPKNSGFNLDDTLIPADQIHSGGPGKDGIPSIDEPQFITAEKNNLKAVDRVLGLNYQSISKAYPIRIMNWHEIVNDEFNGHPVAVTFCPLCGSGVAYSSLIDGKKHTFGVSGLLYNSDVLLYDRETESLWSQLMNQSVSGPLKGQKLTPIPLTHTTWEDWKTRYPDTLVLSENTGFSRNYDDNPYQDYKLDRNIWFPVTKTDHHYHPKELVLGIEINGQSKGYPFVELAKMPIKFQDNIAGELLTISYNQKHQTANIYNQANQEVPTVITFWFAWYAFHPDTLIFQATQK